MKLSIIGRGNAGCLSALHFSHYSDYEIELIYDSNTPTEYVGQASVLELPTMLHHTLGIDLYNNPIYATIKSGILYEGWGKKKDKIFHPFSFGSYGIHYDTRMLQDYILDSLKDRIKVTDRKLSSCDEIDSDYIIDCSGFNKKHRNGKLSEGYSSLINPLNSVLLSNIDETRFHPWTRAVATPHGWGFVIPLHDTVSLGYLYNSNITDKNIAEASFKDMFGVESIRDNFSFQCFIKDNPIEDRVIANGNNLFFLEPLESTAVQAYLFWNRHIFDFIKGDSTAFKCNHYIKEYTNGLQNFINWHYMFGSKYDTEFWRFSKTLKIKNKEFELFKNNPSDKFYSQWNHQSFKIWSEGVS